MLPVLDLLDHVACAFSVSAGGGASGSQQPCHTLPDRAQCHDSKISTMLNLHETVYVFLIIASTYCKPSAK